MTRLAVIALLLAVMVLLFRSFFRSETADSQATEMVQDPNCQTFVPKPEAVRSQIDGRELYFCSRKCAEDYQLKSGKENPPPGSGGDA